MIIPALRGTQDRRRAFYALDARVPLATPGDAATLCRPTYDESHGRRRTDRMKQVDRLPAERSSTAGLSRQAYDLQRPPRRPALRLEGPRHPRGLRRHDRQRQDRARASALIEEAAHRRHAGAGHRPEGRPRQSAADFPSLRRRGLRALGRPGRRRGARPDAGGVCRAAGGTVEEGARRLGPGRRPHRAAARRGRRSRSTRRAAAPACRSRC